MGSLLPSIVRTVVPVVAGMLVTLAVRLGLDLEPATAQALVQPAVTAVYYTAFRYAEKRFDPRFGWFLGYARAPQYDARQEPERQGLRIGDIELSGVRELRWINEPGRPPEMRVKLLDVSDLVPAQHSPGVRGRDAGAVRS